MEMFLTIVSAICTIVSIISAILSFNYKKKARLYYLTISSHDSLMLLSEVKLEFEKIVYLKSFDIKKGTSKKKQAFDQIEIVQTKINLIRNNLSKKYLVEFNSILKEPFDLEKYLFDLQNDSNFKDNEFELNEVFYEAKKVLLRCEEYLKGLVELGQK